MSGEQSLTEIIEQAVAENSVENTQSAPADANSNDTDDVESLLEEIVSSEVLETADDTEGNEFLDDLDDEDDLESESDSDSVDIDDEGLLDDGDNDVVAVKVDGQLYEVSIEELKSGYQRQADYTRKAQALAAERAEFQETVSQFQETVSSLQQLDEAWNDNPVQVLAHFAANTDNPTQAVSMLIRELAVSNMLSQEFMDVFGITPAVRQTWAEQSEVETLRRTVKRTESESQTRAQREEYDAAVQAAIAEYDEQIDQIIAAEGYDLTVNQRDAFRSKLASYARENEITNLKAAWKAMKFENAESKQQLAKKAASRAKQKKAASVVTRSGSGSKGSASVSNSEEDLSSIIRQAMREAGGDA